MTKRLLPLVLLAIGMFALAGCSTPEKDDSSSSGTKPSSDHWQHGPGSHGH